MGITAKPELRRARLRANPAYELVLFDRLSEAEQRTLESLRQDPEGYGVLRPRQAGALSLKSVSRDTALLWLTLQEPGPLPHYAVRMMGEGCEALVAQMILDGVLEIEHEGALLSGMAALPLLAREMGGEENEGAVAGLSRRALRTAAALPAMDPLTLSARLYGYNTVPATAEWRARWRDLDAIERELGIAGDAWQKLLPNWTRVAWGNTWIAWNHPGPTGYETPCKLYVSPGCGAMRTAFQEAAAAMAGSAVHLKIGASVFGLLRPDKMVGYFREMGELRAAAEGILARLGGCPAQGVPFTAELGGGGLLSWGADPPRDDFAVPWLQRESWRARICNRLASALIQGRASAAGESADDPDALCRFALERMELEGIDTRTWHARTEAEA